MDPLKICVLVRPPLADDIPYDPAAYFAGRDWTQVVLTPTRYRQEIDDLLQQRVDVFVNLCDGTADDELSGIDLVRYLEEKGAAFTGAGSAFFDPTRAEMKAAASSAGVPYPRSAWVRDLVELEHLDHDLSFPMIVKPPHGYSSVGLSPSSRVLDEAALHQQTARAIETFGGALLEEFIEGREFTVLVMEGSTDAAPPVTFRPLEFLFPDGESFKHYDLKWKEYARMSVRPLAAPDLEQRLRELSVKQFQAMRGMGYARCDFRMDASGGLFLLEINPNCGIFYPPSDGGSADLILQNDPGRHTRFIELLLASALRRKPAQA
jgi:D-alanine-D-alanine ligase-like ATP-grasp enzyme